MMSHRGAFGRFLSSQVSFLDAPVPSPFIGSSAAGRRHAKDRAKARIGLGEPPRFGPNEAQSPQLSSTITPSRIV